MKFALLLFTMFFLSTSLNASAQQWSSEEQEILDFTNACWETFVTEDVQAYLSSCTHADYTRWPAGALIPFDARSEQRILSDWFSRNSWSIGDIQPSRIEVAGDAAVIHYQLFSFRVSNDGKSSAHTGGRSDFLVRENGTWKVFSVHEHSVSD